ncbi:hypothetical protein [Helicobacter turcicus]|uniref:Phage-Barnase-EndoU-ColicinE5/D-RelE like nuclease 3 domain-containing protein n=1 Tax=Helicobacter turcicus TaxID=2867412 RepID=A0ABS7JPA0_9HELI|nr:hypothetical protein [Helicobacter turcicus]MBX7491226.1 hypothetical protein [Helicobacter turcicus]MBX7546135.1 hypothetical protein [Helicobacter turcicus]
MNKKLTNYIKQSIQSIKNILWNNKKEKSETLKSDLLDKSKPLRMARAEELSNELLNQVIKNNNKIWIDNASVYLNDALGLQNAKITMSGNAINHTLKRHGMQSNLVQKSKQEALSFEDIKNHADFINSADKQAIGISKDNQKVLISGKQINGYYVIVETISKKNNELSLKTMYKEIGKLENSKAFDKVERLLNFKEKSSNPSLQGTSINLDSSHLFTAEIIPQNPNSSYSRFKNQLKNIGENLTKDREKLENTQGLQDSKVDTQTHKSHQLKKVKSNKKDIK